MATASHKGDVAASGWRCRADSLTPALRVASVGSCPSPGTQPHRNTPPKRQLAHDLCWRYHAPIGLNEGLEGA